MFVWAPIPEPFREMGSLEFAKILLARGQGRGLARHRLRRRRRGYVRFALIENEHRTRQAMRGIRHALERGRDAAQARRGCRLRAAPRFLARFGALFETDRIALLGCGTVGEGVVRLLRRNAALFERKLGAPLELAGVADRSLKPIPRSVS